jgi:Fe-S cluster assembly protein DRE2 N-terminus
VLEHVLGDVAGREHHLQMLDRIALNFAQLPENHYSEARLALSSQEERDGRVTNDYTELQPVLPKLLLAMKPGGRVLVGNPPEELIRQALLTGFLTDLQNNQVHHRQS